MGDMLSIVALLLLYLHFLEAEKKMVGAGKKNLFDLKPSQKKEANVQSVLIQLIW
jgi:hypothetical protein